MAWGEGKKGEGKTLLEQNGGGVSPEFGNSPKFFELITMEEGFGEGHNAPLFPSPLCPADLQDMASLTL